MQLAPEEDVTVSVAANDFGDLIEGAVRVVRLPWFAVCDGDECIPLIAVQKLRPSLFKAMIQGVPRPTRITGEAGLLQLPGGVLRLQPMLPPPRVTGTFPRGLGP